jgi:hypothetical protein
VTYQVTDTSEITEDAAYFADVIDDSLSQDTSPPGANT